MPKVTTTLYGDLAVCPYQPEAPIREYLEWMTDVDGAADGSEERRQKRSIPRQSFEYSIPLKVVVAPDFMNMVHGSIRHNWAVPVWNERQYVGTVTNGQTIIDCETTGYSLRESSLVMLWKDTTNWEIGEVQSITATTIVLDSGSSGITGAYLIPVRVCIVDGSFKHRTRGYRGTEVVRFRVLDNRELYALVPDQYDSTDIYYDLNESGEVTKEYNRDQLMTDFGLGGFSQFSQWNTTRITYKYSRLITSYADMYAFKRFLARRAGKFQPFYYPSFENELRITSTGALTNTIDVYDDSILDYAGSRYHIYFRTADNWYPREVDLLTDLGGGEVRIRVTTNLNINAEDILYAGYLGYYRLDTDRVELRHETGTNTRVSIPFVETQPYRVPPAVIE